MRARVLGRDSWCKRMQEQETETEGLDFFHFLFFFSGVWISIPFYSWFCQLVRSLSSYMGPNSKFNSFNRLTAFSFYLYIYIYTSY